MKLGEVQYLSKDELRELLDTVLGYLEVEEMKCPHCHNEKEVCQYEGLCHCTYPCCKEEAE